MGLKFKKPPKNPFSFYLEEYVESQKKSGRKVSYRIAAEECGPSWEELQPEEKQKYIDMATLHKEYSKQDKKNKFTNTGLSYAVVEEQQKEQKLKVEKADAEIRDRIIHLDKETLKTQLFYIIHCNYYCKTDDDVYIPGELAICEFNLQDGVRRSYHTLINPDRIPTGYAYEARQTIKEVHGLPEPPYEEGDSDYFGILDKILNFIQNGKLQDGKYPPLYTTENNLKASENILQSLGETHGEDGNFFRVFPLHKLFFWMKNRCAQFSGENNVAFPVMSVAESEIARDLYAYAPGISCSYHLGCDDKYQNCSLSVVQRHVYVICDHCCQYVNVELVPGKHSRYKAGSGRGPGAQDILSPSQTSEADDASYGQQGSTEGNIETASTAGSSGTWIKVRKKPAKREEEAIEDFSK